MNDLDVDLIAELALETLNGLESKVDGMEFSKEMIKIMVINIIEKYRDIDDTYRMTIIVSALVAVLVENTYLHTHNQRKCNKT